MLIDCHVHAAALVPGRGRVSPALFNGLKFHFLRWRFGLRGSDAEMEDQYRTRLVELVEATTELDAAVALAFDAVHDGEGRLDEARTHLYVTNDYAAALARRHPKLLFGASVHPYRKDAANEVERCVGMGAVLLKWLPVTQDFDPADPRCFPVYDVLAHHKLPLLCHTGFEQMLPTLSRRVADPALLVPALKRGVIVIAAHCGTRSVASDEDYLPAFLRLAEEHEHLYGDTAALNLPTRSYAYPELFRRPAVLRKLVHGSDWPVIPLPPLKGLGVMGALKMLAESNWLRRDIEIKRRLGFDEAYFHRAAELLRLPSRSAARSPDRPADAGGPARPASP